MRCSSKTRLIDPLQRLNQTLTQASQGRETAELLLEHLDLHVCRAGQHVLCQELVDGAVPWSNRVSDPGGKFTWRVAQKAFPLQMNFLGDFGEAKAKLHALRAGTVVPQDVDDPGTSDMRRNGERARNIGWKV